MKDIPMYPGEQLTRFYSGKIRIIQKQAGYRFSIDSALLADFIRITPEQTILELGTGNGIVLILLSFMGKFFKEAVGVEIQKDLAGMADRNVRLNGLAHRIKIIHADFRDSHRLLQGEKFDMVISNPPYLKVDEGRLSPSLEKAVARHELKCNLDDVAGAATVFLKKQGRFVIIYPVSRIEDLNQTMERHRFSPVRRRFVRARGDTSPNLMLLEAGVEEPSKSLKEEGTLTLYDDKQNYTKEAAEILFPAPEDKSPHETASRGMGSG